MFLFELDPKVLELEQLCKPRINVRFPARPPLTLRNAVERLALSVRREEKGPVALSIRGAVRIQTEHLKMHSLNSDRDAKKKKCLHTWKQFAPPHR